MHYLVPALLIGAALLLLAPKVYSRWLLSRAKYPSLAGHVRLARRLARTIPYYEYDDVTFFASDDAPEELVDRRRAGFDSLAESLRRRSRAGNVAAADLASTLSDAGFIGRYRVPFQYSRMVRDNLPLTSFVSESHGVTMCDPGGNEYYDLAGSYGVNVLGNDFYKDCIDAAGERAGALGPVLGPYHPVVADNIVRLLEISGMDEASFHMSGTEAVMQAVRLALFHTGRSRVVRFCGAYHGWWDGVQPGIGNPRRTRDVFTLAEMSERSLDVLSNRADIACVLVNPLQALHPNRTPPGDGTLVNSARSAGFDRQAYTDWLQSLRDICRRKGIVFILDDVFLGFRVAYGGSQEYFRIQADLVTYGKTLGGGLPVGVVCGRHELMKRYREERPADICFARGTFNSHPYVMAAMNEFLTRIATREVQSVYERLDNTWGARAASLNARLKQESLPLKAANLSSVFTMLYTRPSRYNWMLQFYLRDEGLMLPWVGTGRLIFSLNYSEQDFGRVVERIVNAAKRMQSDGWWWQTMSLSDEDIQRRILREIVRQRFPLLRSAWLNRRVATD